MRPELLIEILDKALTEELGVVVETNNSHALTLKFHEQTRNVSKYDSLQICIGSKPDTVLITQKSVELDDAREPE
jgi:hypothetical protein